MQKRRKERTLAMVICQLRWREAKVAGKGVAGEAMCPERWGIPKKPEIFLQVEKELELDILGKFCLEMLANPCGWSIRSN